MRTWVIVYAIVFFMLGITDELFSQVKDSSSQESSPDTPTRVLNEMKGPPGLMQQELLRLLQPEVNRGDITIRSTKDKVFINLADRALFDSGSDQVHPAGADILNRIGSAMKGVPNWKVQLIGHADNQPIKPAAQIRFANNTALSQARAEHGAKILMDSGVDAKLISTAGRGEAQPIASNSTAEGRRKNRRLEIVLETPASADPPVIAAQ